MMNVADDFSMPTKAPAGRLQMRCVALVLWIAIAGLALTDVPDCRAQESTSQEELDSRVRSFLEGSRYSWHDMNVPASDGQLLYDLVVQNNYTCAL